MMIVCTTQGCISDDDPDGPTLTVGDTIPEFSVAMSNGEIISKSSVKGKVPVIIFFNTDCSDCRKELPVIQSLWDNYKDNPEVVIALIARQESADEIETYWNENNFTMPYSPQETRDVYSLFAASIIPRIFIANPEGVITFSSDDSDMPSLEKLTEAINSASSSN